MDGRTVVVENLIASIVSILLTFAGVPCVVKGSVIYIPSIDLRFTVTLSCVDIVGISLWAFMFVFVLWAYSNLNWRPLSRRKYMAFGALGFAIFFFANILRMFIEIWYVTSIGTSYTIYLVQWQTFEEQVGIGIMLTTFAALLLGFHFAFKNQKLRRVVFR